MEPLLKFLHGSKPLWARHMAQYASRYHFEFDSLSLERMAAGDRAPRAIEQRNGQMGQLGLRIHRGAHGKN
jgi:hypothetical protein